MDRSAMHPPDLEVCPPFEIAEPQRLLAPVLFNSPHSGRQYPQRFLESSRLTPLTLRRSEDAFVDELFEGVTDLGVLLMKAHFPRAFLDVNREAYELDPRMFTGRLPPFANTRSVRVAGGLGTIARVVANAEEIYAAPLPIEEGLLRIEQYHKPYHRTLKSLLNRLRSAYGHAMLIDCHSMPSSIRIGSDRARTDFIIGDRYGTSCHPALVHTICKTLRDMGYTVLRNKPYAGGYITEQYGVPVIGSHAIQIEINRDLYMNELQCSKTADFAALKTDMTRLAAAIMKLDLGAASHEAAAAE
jgi:N-formylglutamate amidohydrolase